MRSLLVTLLVTAFHAILAISAPFARQPLDTSPYTARKDHSLTHFTTSAETCQSSTWNLAAHKIYQYFGEERVRRTATSLKISFLFCRDQLEHTEHGVDAELGPLHINHQSDLSKRATETNTNTNNNDNNVNVDVPAGSSEDKDKGGLSKEAKIGIGVGVPSAVGTLVGLYFMARS